MLLSKKKAIIRCMPLNACSSRKFKCGTSVISEHSLTLTHIHRAKVTLIDSWQNTWFKKLVTPQLNGGSKSDSRVQDII